MFSPVCPNPNMVAMQLIGKVWDQIHTQLLLGSLHKSGMQKGFKQDLWKGVKHRYRQSILSHPQLNLNPTSTQLNWLRLCTPPHHPNSTSIKSSLRSTYNVTNNKENIKDNNNEKKHQGQQQWKKNTNNNDNKKTTPKQNKLKIIGLWPHRD